MTSPSLKDDHLARALDLLVEAKRDDEESRSSRKLRCEKLLNTVKALLADEKSDTPGVSTHLLYSEDHDGRSNQGWHLVRGHILAFCEFSIYEELREVAAQIATLAATAQPAETLTLVLDPCLYRLYNLDVQHEEHGKYVLNALLPAILNGAKSHFDESKSTGKDFHRELCHIVERYSRLCSSRSESSSREPIKPSMESSANLADQLANAVSKALVSQSKQWKFSGITKVRQHLWKCRVARKPDVEVVHDTVRINDIPFAESSYLYLMQHEASRVGIELVIQPIPWSEVGAALLTNSIDVAIYNQAIDNQLGGLSRSTSCSGLVRTGALFRYDNYPLIASREITKELLKKLETTTTKSEAEWLLQPSSHLLLNNADDQQIKVEFSTLKEYINKILERSDDSSEDSLQSHYSRSLLAHIKGSRATGTKYRDDMIARLLLQRFSDPDVTNRPELDKKIPLRLALVADSDFVDLLTRMRLVYSNASRRDGGVDKQSRREEHARLHESILPVHSADEALAAVVDGDADFALVGGLQAHYAMSEFCNQLCCLGWVNPEAELSRPIIARNTSISADAWDRAVKKEIQSIQSRSEVSMWCSWADTPDRQRKERLLKDLAHLWRKVDRRWVELSGLSNGKSRRFENGLLAFINKKPKMSFVSSFRELQKVLDYHDTRYHCSSQLRVEELPR